MKWGEIWGLDPNTSIRRSKLDTYFSQGTRTGPHVVHALSRLSALFVDVDTLTAKYGLHATNKEIAG